MSGDLKQSYEVHSGRCGGKLRFAIRQLLVHVLPVFFMLGCLALAMAWVAM